MQLGATQSIALSQSLEFAELSGDFNPLHRDPIAARRTMFRGSVVHGVHALLASLDAWLLSSAPSGRRIAKVSALFQRPIPTGAEFRIEISRSAEARPDEVRLVVSVDGGIAQKIIVELADGAGPLKPRSSGERYRPEAPKARTFAEAAAAEGELGLGFDRELLASLFPNLAAQSADGCVAVLLAATRIVGMECPGLNSVFTGLAYEARETGGLSNRLSYRVTGAEERVGTLKIAAESADASLHITALYRPPVVRQSAFGEMQARVPSRAFEGRNAVVVGGSRGLGEVTAKILAAGGARVWLTYLSGKEDAEAVSAEIQAGGAIAAAGRLEIGAGDIEVPDFADGFLPTHIYLFASPAITAKRTVEWDQALFDRYMRCYVTDAMATVRALSARTGVGLERLTIFIPSSIFIDGPPAALAEYAAAKAAAEVAWQALARVYCGMRIETPRLPRLLTDQTSRLGDSLAARAEEVLLPMLLGAAASSIESHSHTGAA